MLWLHAPHLFRQCAKAQKFFLKHRFGHNPKTVFSSQNYPFIGSPPGPALGPDFDAIQKAFHAAIQPNGIVKPTVFVDNGFEYGVGPGRLWGV